MKKIHNLKELDQEKNRLNNRKHELEKKIGSVWQDIKEDFSPGHIAEEIFETNSENGKSGHANGNLLKSAFILGAAILAKKLADKTEEKIAEFWQE